MGAGLTLVGRVVLARFTLLGSCDRDRWTLGKPACQSGGSGRNLTAGKSTGHKPPGVSLGRLEPCIGLFAFSALLLLGLTPTGCVSTESKQKHAQVPLVVRTAVVAPMLNLSANPQVDPLKITDIFCSELADTQRFSVIPTNLVLSALAAQGKAFVDSPADAMALAESFDADGALVLALTEYDPYDPPVVGFILQWYPRRSSTGGATMNSRLSAGGAEVARPAAQVQRVFNASVHEVLEELREYAEGRSDKESALQWRKYAQSQELYLRYCSWSLIQSMERVLMSGTDAVQPPETVHEHGSSIPEPEKRTASIRISMPGWHGSRAASSGDREGGGAG